MDEQPSIVQQILDSTTFEAAKSIINTIQSQQTRKKIISDVLSVLIQSDQTDEHNRSQNFRIKMLQYATSLSTSLDARAFKSRTIFQLIAVTQGYFQSGLQKQKTRSYFVKGINKQSAYWGLHVLEAFKDNLTSRQNGYRALWSDTSYKQQIQRIGYLLSFYEENSTFFPATVEIRNYLVKYLLIIRLETQADKNIFQRITKQILNSNYSMQIIKSNFRFCLEFFRNTYNEKQYMYYPYKTIIQFLSNFKKYEIEQLIIRSGSIGLIWNYQHFSSCLVNIIKNAGITEHSSTIMKSFIQLAKNHKKYTQIIKAFENNIPKIFIFLKHPKLFPVSFDLLKQFILGPPATTSLYTSFMDKAKSFVKVIEGQNLRQYLCLLETIQFKYKETTITEDIQLILQNQTKNGYIRQDSQQLRKKLNQYDWRIFDQKNLTKIIFENQKGIEQSNYKGLVNIGNSCYMNSFIQCLFMTKQFRRQLLKSSTLQFEKQALFKLHKQYEGDTNVQISTIARQRVRPVAELQRLFALLSRSQRPAVNPSSFKNTGPVQFRNAYQQDSSEYGRSLFQMLHQGYFPHFFEGQMTIQIECPSCHVKRSKQQEFVDLMLNSDQEEDSIQKMVQSSFLDEHIEGLTCDSCQQKSEKSLKRHWISKMPNYLILTIKRFQYNIKENKNVKKKLKAIIQESFKIGEQSFQIYAILVHRGSSANSGHYFTFCRDGFESDSKWVCLNDSDVDSMTNFQKVLQFLDMCPEDTPYIIFSQKISHIESHRKQLDQTIILRLPLQKYVQKDNLQYVKQSTAKPLLNLANLKISNYFRKRDDDSDQEGGGRNNFKDFNAPIS